MAPRRYNHLRWNFELITEGQINIDEWKNQINSQSLGSSLWTILHEFLENFRRGGGGGSLQSEKFVAKNATLCWWCTDAVDSGSESARGPFYTILLQFTSLIFVLCCLLFGGMGGFTVWFIDPLRLLLLGLMVPPKHPLSLFVQIKKRSKLRNPIFCK